jgi:predicted transcriptional regulator
MAEPASERASLVELTTDIASAYVTHNGLASGDLPDLITSVFGALASADGDEPGGAPKSAVPIKRSVTPEYLICLEDGRHFKSLRRHLRVCHGLSPEGYRARWALPKTYPMVAPAYSAVRTKLAKRIGLGRAARAAPKPRTGVTPASKVRARRS